MIQGGVKKQKFATKQKRGEVSRYKAKKRSIMLGAWRKKSDPSTYLKKTSRQTQTRPKNWGKGVKIPCTPCPKAKGVGGVWISDEFLSKAVRLNLNNDWTI